MAGVDLGFDQDYAVSDSVIVEEIYEDSTTKRPSTDFGESNGTSATDALDPCHDLNFVPTTKFMLTHLGVTEYILLPLCTFLTVICIIIYLEEIKFLKKNYKDAERRRRTITVLSVYPMYAVTSLMVLWVPRSVVLMELKSASYFSLILYFYLHLIPDYYGGPEQMMKKLQGLEVSRRKPPCCCCCVCLPPAKFSEKFAGNIKILIFQFAIVRPMLATLSAVLWTNGSYNPGSADPKDLTIYIQVAMTISTMIAVYGMLLVMGVAAPNLPEFRLKPKYLSIQLVLVTTTLIGFIINIVVAQDAIPCHKPFSSTARASQITHTIIILEMVPLSMLGRCFYLQKVEYEGNRNEEHIEGESEHIMVSNGNGQTKHDCKDDEFVAESLSTV